MTTHRPITADERLLLDRLEEAYHTESSLTVMFNEAIAEPHYNRVRDCHIALLNAEAELTGIHNSSLIEYLYPETLAPTPPATSSPTTERIQGVVRYVSMSYGMIDYSVGDFPDSVRFTRILGGVRPVRGMTVEFQIDTFSGQATRVVAVGQAVSEAAYAALLKTPRKETPKHSPIPAANTKRRFGRKESGPIKFDLGDVK